uniref:WSN domain-containing protein n=1 Tax=Panagrellus redivivus TaxID=6233 RepID=A0A7E4VGP0_PANRE
MKFLQLLCIALLLCTVLAASNATNATDAEALLKYHVEKLVELKNTIEKTKQDGNFKDRGLFDAIASMAKAIGNTLG